MYHVPMRTIHVKKLSKAGVSLGDNIVAPRYNNQNIKAYRYNQLQGLNLQTQWAHHSWYCYQF